VHRPALEIRMGRGIPSSTTDHPCLDRVSPSRFGNQLSGAESWRPRWQLIDDRQSAEPFGGRLLTQTDAKVGLRTGKFATDEGTSYVASDQEVNYCNGSNGGSHGRSEHSHGSAGGGIGFHLQLHRHADVAGELSERWKRDLGWSIQLLCEHLSHCR
jgi:hypothetical protein